MRFPKLSALALALSPTKAMIDQERLRLQEKQEKEFEMWQKQECTHLDISKEDHDELLEKVVNKAALSGSSPWDLYAAIKSAIPLPSSDSFLIDFSGADGKH